MLGEREIDRLTERGRQSSKFMGQGDFFGKLHSALAARVARLAALRFVDCVFNYNKVTDRWRDRGTDGGCLSLGPIRRSAD